MPPSRPKKKKTMRIPLKIHGKEKSTKNVSKHKITPKSKSHLVFSSSSDTDKDRNTSSRKRSSSASSGGLTTSKAKQTRHEKQRPPQEKESDVYTERKISARTLGKWKPVQKSTKDVVVNMIDGAIMSTLNDTSAVSYSNVQEHLNIMRARLLSRLTQLKVPPVRYNDYKRMDNQCKYMDEVLLQGSNQMMVMEGQMKKLDECLKKKEEELVNVDESIKQFESNGAKWKKKCHPILNDHFVDTLGIPPLPDDRDHLPFPQVEDFDPKRSGLLHNLTDFSKSDGVHDLNKYVENIVAVTNVLVNQDENSDNM